jgi:hypothetical protein
MRSLLGSRTHGQVVVVALLNRALNHLAWRLGDREGAIIDKFFVVFGSHLQDNSDDATTIARNVRNYLGERGDVGF